jgi:hypothetical protein
LSAAAPAQLCRRTSFCWFVIALSAALVQNQLDRWAAAYRAEAFGT